MSCFVYLFFVYLGIEIEIMRKYCNNLKSLDPRRCLYGAIRKAKQAEKKATRREANKDIQSQLED